MTWRLRATRNECHGNVTAKTARRLGLVDGRSKAEKLSRNKGEKNEGNPEKQPRSKRNSQSSRIVREAVRWLSTSRISRSGLLEKMPHHPRRKLQIKTNSQVHCMQTSVLKRNCQYYIADLLAKVKFQAWSETRKDRVILEWMWWEWRRTDLSEWGYRIPLRKTGQKRS